MVLFLQTVGEVPDDEALRQKLAALHLRMSDMAKTLHSALAAEVCMPFPPHNFLLKL